MLKPLKKIRFFFKLIPPFFHYKRKQRGIDYRSWLLLQVGNNKSKYYRDNDYIKFLFGDALIDNDHLAVCTLLDTFGVDYLTSIIPKKYLLNMLYACKQIGRDDLVNQVEQLMEKAKQE